MTPIFLVSSNQVLLFLRLMLEFLLLLLLSEFLVFAVGFDRFHGDGFQVFPRFLRLHAGFDRLSLGEQDKGEQEDEDDHHHGDGHRGVVDVLFF